MLKKILYALFAVVIGFVVFYISWRDACSTAVVRQGNAALKEGNYEFFLKFFEKYEKECAIEEQYTVDSNTTTIRVYNVYSTKVATDEDKPKEYSSRSGFALFITDINTTDDYIIIDSQEPSDDVSDEDPATRITFTADNGKTYTSVVSTYGYESSPIVIFSFFTTEFKDCFVEKNSSDPTPTKITHIKIVDSEENVFFDKNINLELVEHNDVEYWDALVEEGKAGVIYSSKEYRDKFSFPFPEMTKTFIITGVAILVMIGLGVFIFWPKKSYVPTKADEDKEKYTFASTEEKEKYALAKVAKGKKEKADRENRYKNVRTEKSLDELTDEAIEESMDKENTAEAAIAKDEELEAKEVESETKEIESTEETIEENKEEN